MGFIVWTGAEHQCAPLGGYCLQGYDVARAMLLQVGLHLLLAFGLYLKKALRSGKGGEICVALNA